MRASGRRWRRGASKGESRGSVAGVTRVERGDGEGRQKWREWEYGDGVVWQERRGRVW